MLCVGIWWNFVFWGSGWPCFGFWCFAVKPVGLSGGRLRSPHRDFVDEISIWIDREWSGDGRASDEWPLLIGWLWEMWSVNVGLLTALYFGCRKMTFFALFCPFWLSVNLDFDESATIRSGMVELVGDTITFDIIQRVLFWSVFIQSKCIIFWK